MTIACEHSAQPEPVNGAPVRCLDCGQEVCGNRNYANEPGCRLPPGHDDWHSDGWSTWKTNERDEIVAREGW